MKKLLVLTLITITITGLVACGANDKKAEENKNNSQIEQQLGNKENKDEETILAKVTKIVGNEISVNLSEDNFELEVGQAIQSDEMSYELDESQLKALENGEIIQMQDGSIIANITSDPNTNLNENLGISDEELQKLIEVGEAADGTDEENGDIFDGISFNAGAKDFAISAGVKIVDTIIGKDGKLIDIKEGSILNITIDKNTNTVTRIDIWG